jgi:hypothetical protein
MNNTQTLDQERIEERRAFETSTVLSHIDRYNLGGEIEPVTWDVSGNTLTIGFVSPDNTIIGELNVDDFSAGENVDLNIRQTSRLQKLIKILNDRFDMSFEYAGNEARTLVLEDDQKTVEFRLSDPSIIPNTPNLKRLPDFQVEMEVADQLASDFRSAESALDEDEFAVRTTPTGVEVVVGYTADSRREHNNKVTLPVSVEEYENFDNNNVTFKADIFAEILKANSDSENGIWEVSDEGLSHIQFESEDWDVSYYFVSQQEV